MQAVFYPMHLQLALRKRGLFGKESYPVSEKLWERGFYIQSGLGVSEEQQQYIAEQIADIMRDNKAEVR